LIFGCVAVFLSSFYFSLGVLRIIHGGSYFLPSNFDQHFSVVINFLSGFSTLSIALYLQHDVYGFAGKIWKYFSFYSSFIILGYWSAMFFFVTGLKLPYIWLTFIPLLIHLVVTYIDKDLSRQTSSIGALAGMVVNEYKGA
jgi:hypothetical protein